MGSLRDGNHSDTPGSRGKAQRANLALLKELKSRKYSSLEIERLTADLECVSRRLGSREYKQSDFRPRNTLLIPDRTDEIVNDLAFYWSVGKVWQSLLAVYFNQRHLSVAELGCGHISKVGLGLIYNNFVGHLTLIDQDSKALARARDCLTFFGSRFLCSGSAQSVYTGIARQFDAIVANHLLDDLILDWHCNINGISMDSLYASEALYISSWQKIVEQDGFIEQLPQKLAQSLSASLKPEGMLILLDYPSFSHKALGLKNVIALVRKIQRRLRLELASLGFRSALNVIPDIRYGRLKVTSRDLIVANKPGGGNAI